VRAEEDERIRCRLERRADTGGDERGEPIGTPPRPHRDVRAGAERRGRALVVLVDGDRSVQRGEHDPDHVVDAGVEEGGGGLLDRR